MFLLLNSLTIIRHNFMHGRPQTIYAIFTIFSMKYFMQKCVIKYNEVLGPKFHMYY